MTSHIFIISYENIGSVYWRCERCDVSFLCGPGESPSDHIRNIVHHIGWSEDCDETIASKIHVELPDRS